MNRTTPPGKLLQNLTSINDTDTLNITNTSPAVTVPTSTQPVLNPFSTIPQLRIPAPTANDPMYLESNDKLLILILCIPIFMLGVYAILFEWYWPITLPQTEKMRERAEMEESRFRLRHFRRLSSYNENLPEFPPPGYAEESHFSVIVPPPVARER
jgi:hypothetical protein